MKRINNLKAEVFYVIKMNDNKYYRRNHESCGGVRPTHSVVLAEQFVRFDKAKIKYDELKEKGYGVIGIARFGLLKGEMLD